MLFSNGCKRRVRRNERFFGDVLFLIFSFRFWQGFFFKVVRNYEGFVNEMRHNQAKKKQKRSMLIASQATSVAFILLLRSLDPVGEKWVKWALNRRVERFTYHGAALIVQIDGELDIARRRRVEKKKRREIHENISTSSKNVKYNKIRRI